MILKIRYVVVDYILSICNEGSIADPYVEGKVNFDSRKGM
jgi:hypothetical protein